ncbi:tyrosyl-tRNA synthetase [Desulfonispora thiosulfatigenes DSM 11270]|uniref:Tyrosine--tRNA ligase n=1 Tax=Desulfonispora thiosulfatigenes DSM 11270 TaxID=656914 RepID=A0A1W1VRF0_DESTI|nr:tyrosine--tRNA ligase [Desulfonispora thiosulfatigenes]SMB95952.1 tyrosyl-tRNA synthetase [Desulfonispora thiosulfatigenes DSM 11270]
MAQNVYNTLLERGYIDQSTHEDEIIKLLENESVTFYTGFDPTADSLHVGHFIQIMVMMHMQKAGHKPLALIGGGTVMIGDPSGRTDMRQMLNREQINTNVQSFKETFTKFIEFGEDKAELVDNADWLLNLNYVEFIRDIGRHFSVNRMLTAECFKTRLEKGLSFLEFNYMLMQSYDFLELYNRYNCKMQLGGSDQWSNILGGVDLIRRSTGGSAYGLTFKLLTTSEGKKMGKTQAGAVWLDPKKTSPYDFYQYWRNVDDPDVEKCLSLLTFIPMDEVKRLAALEGAEINKAKEILAYEVTKLVHGEEEAKKAEEATKTLFGSGGSSQSIPSTEVQKERLKEDLELTTLLIEAKLISSKSEGRRLIQQGGLSKNDVRVTDFNIILNEEDFIDNKMMIKKGKKVYHQFIII